MAGVRAFSKQTISVLRLLAAHPQSWRYGYDLMGETGLRSGTLYPLLMRLADQGLLESEWRPPLREGRPARHAYRLTAGGLEAARAHPGRAAVRSANGGLATT